MHAPSAKGTHRASYNLRLRIDQNAPRGASLVKEPPTRRLLTRGERPQCRTDLVASLAHVEKEGRHGGPRRRQQRARVDAVVHEPLKV